MRVIDDSSVNSPNLQISHHIDHPLSNTQPENIRCPGGFGLSGLLQENLTTEHLFWPCVAQRKVLTDETQQFSNSPQKQTPPTQHAEARHALHRRSANLLTLSTRQRAHYANRHTSDKRDENYTTGYVNTPTPHANMIIPLHSENITPTLTPTPPPPTSPSRSSNEQVTHYDYTSRKPTPSKQNPHN